MKEFLVLISQILIIFSVQQLSEIMFDQDKKPFQARLISIACFAGSFSLILAYVYTHVLKELVTALKLTF